MTKSEPSDLPPQDRIAHFFMAGKGYPNIEPRDTIRVDDTYVWYFYYELPEGILEVEVSWEEDTEWEAHVASFVLNVDRYSAQEQRDRYSPFLPPG